MQCRVLRSKQYLVVAKYVSQIYTAQAVRRSSTGIHTGPGPREYPQLIFPQPAKVSQRITVHSSPAGLFQTIGMIGSRSGSGVHMWRCALCSRDLVATATRYQSRLIVLFDSWLYSQPIASQRSTTLNLEVFQILQDVTTQVPREESSIRGVRCAISQFQ